MVVGPMGDDSRRSPTRGPRGNSGARTLTIGMICTRTRTFAYKDVAGAHTLCIALDWPSRTFSIYIFARVFRHRFTDITFRFFVSFFFVGNISLFHRNTLVVIVILLYYNYYVLPPLWSVVVLSTAERIVKFRSHWSHRFRLTIQYYTIITLQD